MCSDFQDSVTQLLVEPHLLRRLRGEKGRPKEGLDSADGPSPSSGEKPRKWQPPGRWRESQAKGAESGLAGVSRSLRKGEGRGVVLHRGGADILNVKSNERK